MTGVHKFRARWDAWKKVDELAASEQDPIALARLWAVRRYLADSLFE